MAIYKMNSIIQTIQPYLPMLMPIVKIILDPVVLLLGFVFILGICVARGKLMWFLVFLILGGVLVYFDYMFKAMNFLS